MTCHSSHHVTRVAKSPHLTEQGGLWHRAQCLVLDQGSINPEQPSPAC